MKRADTVYQARRSRNFCLLITFSQESAHHCASSLARKDFKGPLLESMVSIASGTAIDKQPLAVQELLATWRFVPTDERNIERHHATVAARKRKCRNMGPVLISLSNRWPDIESLFDSPCAFSVFLECFAQAKRIFALPAALGIEGHPVMQRVLTLLRLSQRARRAPRSFHMGKVSPVLQSKSQMRWFVTSASPNLPKKGHAFLGSLLGFY